MAYYRQARDSKTVAMQGLKPGAQKVADNAVPKTKQFNEEQLKPGAEKAGEGLKAGADRASQGLQNAADQVSQQAGIPSAMLLCCLAARE